MGGQCTARDKLLRFRTGHVIAIFVIAVREDVRGSRAPQCVLLPHDRSTEGYREDRRAVRRIPSSHNHAREELVLVFEQHVLDHMRDRAHSGRTADLESAIA